MCSPAITTLLPSCATRTVLAFCGLTGLTIFEIDESVSPG